MPETHKQTHTCDLSPCAHLCVSVCGGVRVCTGLCGGVYVHVCGTHVCVLAFDVDGLLTCMFYL